MDADGIQDLFQELGPLRIRRMFGAHGIYAGERMFALEEDGEIYLKVDEANRAAFEEAGSRPFVYEAKGKTITISYWLMPSEGLDDPAAAARWGRLAIEASARAATPRRRKP